MTVWNPWHGCHKISPGCQNCYVYRRDERVGKDSSLVVKTKAFDLPIQQYRRGGYKLTGEGGSVFACMTSDFFVDEADAWRQEVWEMIRARADLHFNIITKRIHRFVDCLPPDWGEGYENVSIGCTVEDQPRADFRLPIFYSVPIRHRFLICEPLLGPLDLTPHLKRGTESLVAGGESGPAARVCDYAWILSLREQCSQFGIPFYFKQTGARFRKEGRVYQIPRKYQHEQAKKANLSVDNWKDL